MAITDLIKVQIGQAAAWGDVTAATAKVMGITDATLSAVEPVHHTEKSNWMRPSRLAVQTGFYGEGSFSMDLSYEDLLYPLDNFFSQCTPAGTVWTYNPPLLSAVTTPNHYSIEVGATDAGYTASGALITELNISGEAAGIWTGTFPFVCEDVDDQAMTAALVDRAVELIRMADTTLQLDAWGTAAGTAAASASTLISFALNVKNGRHLKTFAGALQPTAYGETKWSGTLTTVLEFNAIGKAIVDALLTPVLTQRAIRIGATSAGKYARIDFYGTLIDGTTLFEDRDGNITVSLTWEGTYQPTQGTWMVIAIDNDFAGALV